MFAWKRKRKGIEAATYSYRFEWQGEVITRKTQRTSEAEALADARAHQHALQTENIDLARQLRMRKAVVKLPLADLIAAYEKAPDAPKRANAKTRSANVNAFKNFCATAGVTVADAGAEILGSARVVWDFKAAIEKKAGGEDEERRSQIFRSANSTLRQARSLFSKDMLEHYERHTALKLPDLGRFLAAPGFKGVPKDEYHAPPDTIVVKTFAELEKLGAPGASESDRNIFIACWLALGFGLRASEIGKVRRNWFIAIDEVVWLAGTELAKNKKFPRVRAQLGAWDKLAPHIESLAGDAFVITGTDTERKEDVFRRVSTWMRSLGWETQHHIHELRAWAGCQIAEKSPRGLLDAQTFLRHAQFSTTEKFYGHHMKRRLDEVKLVLPVLPAAGTLQIVNGGQQ